MTAINFRQYLLISSCRNYSHFCKEQNDQYQQYGQMVAPQNFQNYNNIKFKNISPPLQRPELVAIRVTERIAFFSLVGSTEGKMRYQAACGLFLFFRIILKNRIDKSDRQSEDLPNACFVLKLSYSHCLRDMME